MGKVVLLRCNIKEKGGLGMTKEWLFLMRPLLLSMLVLIVVCAGAAQAQVKSRVPKWVVYPGKEWVKITPAQAGFDAAKFKKMVGSGKPDGKKGEKGSKWGAVLTRGGYFVHAWGDPDYKHQTASLGKAFTWAVLGLAVDKGLLKPNDPIHKSWTGKGQLSHPHKHLDRGHQKTLTWMHLLNHQGGIPISGGHNWKPGATGAYAPPAWAKCTGDVMFDNYCHAKPGTKGMYSSAGYWRLGQALTAVWKKDMKKVLDEKLFRHMGIPADRWDWTTGGLVHFKRDFYPHMVGYGDFLDPPYYIKGLGVRGGPGWVIMSAKDLARFGLLVATGGVWKGKRLISSRWIRGHGGGNNSGVSGDRTTFIAWGVVTSQGHPRPGAREIVGPVDLSRKSSRVPAAPKKARKSSKSPAPAPASTIAAAPGKLFAQGYVLAWEDDKLLPLEARGGKVVSLAGKGGVRLAGGAHLRSIRPAAALTKALVKSGDLSVEVWLRPANLSQVGPARIVSISGDPLNRNFTLGQLGSSIEMRLRTTATNANGMNPHLATSAGVLNGKRQHVVFVRRGERHLFYVDGKLVASGKVPGDLSNWDHSYPLLVGNETTADRTWQGEIYRVTFFNRALTKPEVAKRFAGLPALK